MKEKKDEFQALLKGLNYLSPKPLIVKGVLSYSESLRNRNTIRIKKEIMNTFNGFSKEEQPHEYVMECYQKYEDFMLRIGGIIKDKEVIPILLFLCKK